MGPSTEGPAEKVEYGPTWPGKPGNMRVPPNCASMLIRCHCSLTPSCASGSSAAEDGDLRRGVLLQREGHGLVERQAHHACGSLRRQRGLLPLGLGGDERGSEQQAEKRDVKDNVRALGVLLAVRLAAPSGRTGDFFDRLLVQASLRHQAATLAVNFLQ